MSIALTKKDEWVVQEYIESLPFVGQSGERGCALQDVVWGLFVFGSQYGGAFLRLANRNSSSGVINAAQGASEGIILQMNNDPVTPSLPSHSLL